MTPVSIRITGHPVAKGRHRMTRSGIAYTPAKTRKWEADARMVARVEMAGRPPLTGALMCEIMVVFQAPKSWPKWKRACGYVHHTARPDLDNVVKAAKDSMNGIVWLDDAQVVELWASKHYNDVPSVTITVVELSGVCSQTKTKPEALEAP